MKNVLVFLAQGFEMMEFSVFIDVMGWAREDFGLDVQVTTCGFAKTVVSTFGVPVTVDTTLDQVAAGDFDALAIPGGFESYGFYDEAFDSRVLDLVRSFDAVDKPLAAVCVAALVLGRSGILEGRRATTYHLQGGERQERLRSYGVQVVNEAVVVDGNVVTSYCPETAPAVAFQLLEMLTSREAANAVREAMGFFPVGESCV